MVGSEEYRTALEESKRHHASSKTYNGKLVRPHMPFVKYLIESRGCATMLDYGCGKGLQYEFVMTHHGGVSLEQWLGAPVTKYDPAWPPFATEPTGRFDLVICTHTLGAIPAQDRGWVIERLARLSNKVVYIAEQIGPPKKKVFSNIEAMARPPHRADWQRLLETVSWPELILATKDRSEGGMIEHRRLVGSQWERVTWPEGVRPLDHTWA